MLKRKTSLEEFKEIVSNSTGVKDMMHNLGLDYSFRYRRILHFWLRDFEIDISHFLPDEDFRSVYSLQEILIENSTYGSSTELKKRLLKEGILEEVCSICNIDNIWKGKPMVMIMDHINGDHLDNRLENLRIVCRNCDGQLDTFCRGKSIPVKKPERSSKAKLICLKKGCNNLILSLRAVYCSKECLPNRSQVRPSSEQLQEDLNTLSWVAVGKKYGVSDNAVRKWAKKYGVTPPENHTKIVHNNIPKEIREKTFKCLEKGRKYGSQHDNSKLTEEQVKEIRERYSKGERSPQIAMDYDMTPRSIINIVNRDTWKHI
jgi:hypothetical protein